MTDSFVDYLEEINVKKWADKVSQEINHNTPVEEIMEKLEEMDCPDDVIDLVIQYLE